jgi:transposase
VSIINTEKLVQIASLSSEDLVAKESPNKQIEHKSTQVKANKASTVRRKFSMADKKRLISEFDRCPDPLSRGEFLRKEGLYYASITKWKKQVQTGVLNRSAHKAHQQDLIHQQVLRENARLKQQLSQAEAIIEIQKKVAQLLNGNSLDQEQNGGNS